MHSLSDNNTAKDTSNSALREHIEFGVADSPLPFDSFDSYSPSVAVAFSARSIRSDYLEDRHVFRTQTHNRHDRARPRIHLRARAVAFRCQEVRDVAHDRQMAVHYDDLNISHRAGAQALLYRLAGAATVVCNGLPDLRNLEQMMAYRACKRDAMDRAVVLIGAPEVTLLYGGIPGTKIARR